MKYYQANRLYFGVAGTPNSHVYRAIDAKRKATRYLQLPLRLASKTHAIRLERD